MSRKRIGFRKFTKSESELIISFVEDYTEANNIEITDLCSISADSRKKNRRRRYSELWKKLYELFPDRSNYSVWEHAKRHIYKKYVMKEQSGAALTKEEWVVFEQLLQQHGNKYAEIGRKMGKYEKYLAALHARIPGRINSGLFSVDENLELLRSIQRHTMSSGCSVADIPKYRLPWKSISKDMGEKRYAIDYERHWDQLRSSLLIGWGIEGVHKSNAKQAISTSGKKAKEAQFNISLSRAKSMVVLEELLAINEKLEDGICDESEVYWTHLDRRVGLSVGDSLRRWKVLTKECPSNISKDDFQEKLQFLLNKYKISAESSSVKLDANQSISSNNNESVNPYMGTFRILRAALSENNGNDFYNEGAAIKNKMTENNVEVAEDVETDETETELDRMLDIMLAENDSIADSDIADFDDNNDEADDEEEGDNNKHFNTSSVVTNNHNHSSRENNHNHSNRDNNHNHSSRDNNHNHSSRDNNNININNNGFSSEQHFPSSNKEKKSKRDEKLILHDNSNDNADDDDNYKNRYETLTNNNITNNNSSSSKNDDHHPRQLKSIKLEKYQNSNSHVNEIYTEYNDKDSWTENNNNIVENKKKKKKQKHSHIDEVEYSINDDDTYDHNSLKIYNNNNNNYNNDSSYSYDLMDNEFSSEKKKHKKLHKHE